MGLLTTDRLHEETAIDRLAPWTADELDGLMAGLLREPPPEEADPLACAELSEQDPIQQPRERAPDRWFGLELWLFWALVTHET